MHPLITIDSLQCRGELGTYSSRQGIPWMGCRSITGLSYTHTHAHCAHFKESSKVTVCLWMCCWKPTQTQQSGKTAGFEPSILQVRGLCAALTRTQLSLYTDTHIFASEMSRKVELWSLYR